MGSLRTTALKSDKAANSPKHGSINNRGISRRILGVEGGGTKTAWLLVEAVTSE
jgi:hypothetical protein